MARHDWTDGDIATDDRLDALPGGVMGYVVSSTADSGISTVTDITGLTVTWTAEAARLYKITVFVQVLQSSSTGLAVVTITDGSNTQKAAAGRTLGAAEYGAMNLTLLETGLSGSTTRKARLTTDAGTVETIGDANDHPLIIVEDVGIA